MPDIVKYFDKMMIVEIQELAAENLENYDPEEVAQIEF
jgi:hypothetical protein